MSENTFRDICRIRLRMIDLIKSFFIGEPDAEKLARWRGIFTALSKEQISADLDPAIRKLCELLDSLSLDGIQDEYYRFFGNPFSKELVEMSASFYADKKNYGQTLANLRGLLDRADIVREKDVTDPEDVLPVILDSHARLIETEMRNEDEDVSALQSELLEKYLYPLATRIKEDLQGKEGDFYQACGAFLFGYVELERGLFEKV